MVPSDLERKFFERFQVLFPQRAAKLYSDSQYEAACSVLSRGYTSNTIPLNNRVLLGLSIIKIGDISFGLHHLSFAFELTPHSIKSFSFFFLSLGFGLSGFYDISSKLLDQARWFEMPELSQSDYDTYCNITPVDTDSTGKDPSSKLSLKSKCFQVHKVIQETISNIFEARNFNIDYSIAYGYLRKTALSIMELPQLTVIFDSLGEDNNLFFWFFAKYFGEVLVICLKENPETALSTLITAKSSIDTYAKVIMIKCILSFKYVITGNYEPSFQGFQWALRFNSAFKEINNTERGVEVLYEGTEMCIALMAARSYLQCKNSITVGGLKQRIFDILDASKGLDTSKEIHRHKLDYYFTTIGFLFQKKAIMRKHGTTINEVQLQQDDLEEMIRKFILVTNIIPRDDGALTRIFDELLAALLLYGNLHVKVIWIFKTLRDYFTLESHLHNCPFAQDYLSRYSSFNEIKKSLSPTLHRIMNFKEECKTEDFDYATIDDDLTSAFLIPKFNIHVENGELISAAHSKTNGEDDERFTLSQEEIRALINKSNQFIKLWFDSYNDYHGALAKQIYIVFQKLTSIP